MPYVDTGNGVMDLGSDFRFNSGGSALLNDPTGNNTDQGEIPTQVSTAVKPDARFGDWFDFPDGCVTISEAFLGNNPPVLSLANNTQIILQPGEAVYTVPWIHFGTEYVVRNVHVRLTRNTLPAILYMGYITDREAAAILGSNRPTPEGVTRNTNPLGLPDFSPHDLGGAVGAVKFGSAAIIVVAIVVATIWFLPHTGGK